MDVDAGLGRLRRPLTAIISTKKGLELSVVTQDAMQHFRFPTPYELHFWRTAA